MKKVKALITIFTIIIIAIIFFILIKDFNKPEYTLKEIQELMSEEIPDNVYFKGENFDANGDSSLIAEVYVNGDNTYSHEILIEDGKKTLDTERLYNTKENFEINIQHHYNSISLDPIDNEYNKNPFLRYMQMSKNLLHTHDKYKYFGTENLEGKECIKISLSNKNSETYFYINKEDNRMIKIESYQDTKVSNLEESNINNGKFPLAFTIQFTYSYGTVTNEDIPNININDYPDYNFTDNINIEGNTAYYE